MYYTHLKVKLIRLACPEAPHDFWMMFAMQTFIDGVIDCELQQHTKISSEALLYALEFEAANPAYQYINGFILSHCS